jgi:LPXTG-motif cell wall-anchored protein
MKIRIMLTMFVGAVALAASALVSAQQGAFTATGLSCDQVTWTEEALRSYPRITSACRDVLERDGTYFVKFEGEVRQVADQGRQISIDFLDGDRLTLMPPENLSIVIDGRQTAPRDLRRGDQLSFYIPQNQLVATFFAGQPETAPAQTVPIAPAPAPEQEQVAAATPAERGVLPSTASTLPLFGAAGLILVALGAALTIRRRSRASA